MCSKFCVLCLMLYFKLINMFFRYMNMKIVKLIDRNISRKVSILVYAVLTCSLWWSIVIVFVVSLLIAIRLPPHHQLVDFPLETFIPRYCSRLSVITAAGCLMRIPRGTNLVPTFILSHCRIFNDPQNAYGQFRYQFNLITFIILN